MTETTENAAGAPAGSGARKGGLSAMLLPELRQIAGGLGIKATGMRKGDLIEAIKAAQSGGQSSAVGHGNMDGTQRGAQRQDGLGPDIGLYGGVDHGEFLCWPEYRPAQAVRHRPRAEGIVR